MDFSKRIDEEIRKVNDFADGLRDQLLLRFASAREAHDTWLAAGADGAGGAGATGARAETPVHSENNCQFSPALCGGPASAGALYWPLSPAAAVGHRVVPVRWQFHCVQALHPRYQPT